MFRFYFKNLRIEKTFSHVGHKSVLHRIKVAGSLSWCRIQVLFYIQIWSLLSKLIYDLNIIFLIYCLTFRYFRIQQLLCPWYQRKQYFWWARWTRMFVTFIFPLNITYLSYLKSLVHLFILLSQQFKIFR